MNRLFEQLFALLRLGLGIEAVFSFEPYADDWRKLHDEAVRQSVSGVAFAGLERLDAAQKPPKGLLIQWAVEAQRLRAINKSFDIEARRLTQLFDGLGMRSTILKGQGNALSYPGEGLRMPGDIDIYAEGGKKHVVRQLGASGLIGENEEASYHHIHILPGESGIVVEVHFRPSSGLRTPWRNSALQRMLNEEIAKSEMCGKGFRVPSARFNLMMQLAHLQRHFLSSGIGLRHVIDFYFVLQNATDAELAEARKLLPRFGMRRFATALMWLIGEMLCLDRQKMIAAPDATLGAKLLAGIAGGGNFGKYLPENRMGLVHRIALSELRKMKLLPVCPSEVVWGQLIYLYQVMRTIPKRVRRGRLSLTDRNKIR